MAEFTPDMADCSNSIGIVRYQLNVQEYREDDSLVQVPGFPRDFDPSTQMFNVDNLGKLCVCVCVCVCGRDVTSDDIHKFTTPSCPVIFRPYEVCVSAASLAGFGEPHCTCCITAVGSK